MNEEIPPQLEQINQVPQGAEGYQDGIDSQVPTVEVGDEVPVVPTVMASVETREALFTLARAMTTQVNRDITLGLMLWRILKPQD